MAVLPFSGRQHSPLLVDQIVLKKRLASHESSPDRRSRLSRSEVARASAAAFSSLPTGRTSSQGSTARMSRRASALPTLPRSWPLLPAVQPAFAPRRSSGSTTATCRGDEMVGERAGAEATTLGRCARAVACQR